MIRHTANIAPTTTNTFKIDIAKLAPIRRTELMRPGNTSIINKIIIIGIDVLPPSNLKQIASMSWNQYRHIKPQLTLVTT